MGDEQDNLLTSFPGFITAIEQTLMIDDFHVMVVDAGPVAAAGCEGSLGAGQLTSAAGQDCGLGGTRYATQATPDLTGAFTCMASRGYEGSPNEKTMDALVNSVTVLNGAGQCNADFLRDDAILVVTVITDEEDDSLDGLFNPPLDGSCQAADQDINSFGSPSAWKDALVAAKNGNDEAIVMLGLFGDCDIGGACPGINYDPDDPVTPYTGAEPAPRLRAFTESFEHGVVGSVCAAEYTQFFLDAVSVIDTTCEEFVPPG
jgi:hypothetical protein